VIPRVLAACAWTLASLAAILAAVGIYGVTSYLVVQRTREIGIRMALGATTADVRRLMVRQGMMPAMTGALFGLAGAAAVSALLRSTLAAPSNPDLLFGVAAFDAPTFAATVAFVAALAAAASYFPARHATRVDPVVALRTE